MENALVLVSNASIQSFDELMPAIEYSRSKKAVIVVCREISGAALQSVAINVSAEISKCALFKPRIFRFWQDERQLTFPVLSVQSLSMNRWYAAE